MAKFRVGCFWQVGGYATVEADNVEEAIGLVKSDDFPLPDQSFYVEGSFDIDYDSVIEEGGDTNGEEVIGAQ